MQHLPDFNIWHDCLALLFDNTVWHCCSQQQHHEGCIQHGVIRHMVMSSESRDDAIRHITEQADTHLRATRHDMC